MKPSTDIDFTIVVRDTRRNLVLGAADSDVNIRIADVSYDFAQYIVAQLNTQLAEWYKDYNNGKLL